MGCSAIGRGEGFGVSPSWQPLTIGLAGLLFVTVWTRFNGLLRTSEMPIEINGLTYVTASEVVDKLDVSRQTLWRWRHEGKIPSGHRFRNRQVVFTPAEVKEIELFATRVDPIDPSDKLQRDFFRDR
jgi:predicted DNA-binding transcriptional regulator AlpA